MAFSSITTHHSQLTIHHRPRPPRPVLLLLFLLSDNTRIPSHMAPGPWMCATRNNIPPGKISRLDCLSCWLELVWACLSLAELLLLLPYSRIYIYFIIAKHDEPSTHPRAWSSGCTLEESESPTTTRGAASEDLRICPGGPERVYGPTLDCGQ